MSHKKFGQRGGFEGWSSSIQSIMDEMLNRHFVQFRDDGNWQPATNVYERPDAYFLCVDLAGMDDREIDVRCPSPTRITLAGHRRQPRPQDVEGALSIHVLEIDEGPFRRIVDLPEAIVVDGIEASYSRGFLWIFLPKAKPE